MYAQEHKSIYYFSPNDNLMKMNAIEIKLPEGVVKSLEITGIGMKKLKEEAKIALAIELFGDGRLSLESSLYLYCNSYKSNR